MAEVTNVPTGFGGGQGQPVAVPAPPPPDRALSERMRNMREKMDEEAKSKNRFVAFISSRRLHTVLICSGLVWLCFLIPHWLWELSPEIPLKLVVVDKTVPFVERREHRALFWLLLQSKFVKPGVEGNARFYSFRDDYIGSHPTNKEGTERKTDLLDPEDLDGANILYFADTYGVYSADYTQFPDQQAAATEHSGKLFGGLEEGEVAATEQFAAKGGTVIGEFSTFASPTPPDLRHRMEQVMGVNWTGWVGRYFTDFSDEKDVPKWLYDLYQKKTGHKWDITGSGYMLCKDEEENFIILRDGNGESDGDVLPAGLRFVPASAYTNDDVMSGVEPATFNYWFDVMNPSEGTDELAKYEWNVTATGREKLREAGLELEFPAVIRRQTAQGTSYYFAGEYVDFFRSMGPPDTRATLFINRSFYGRPVAGSTEFFYWSTAYPLISNILRRESNRMTGKPEDVYIFDPSNNWWSKLFGLTQL